MVDLLKADIRVNKVRCKHCGNTIESKHTHDSVWCSCGSCNVDGGLEYLKRAFKHYPVKDYEELSVVYENGKLVTFVADDNKRYYRPSVANFSKKI